MLEFDQASAYGYFFVVFWVACYLGFRNAFHDEAFVVCVDVFLDKACVIFLGLDVVPLDAFDMVRVDTVQCFDERWLARVFACLDSCDQFELQVRV